MVVRALKTSREVLSLVVVSLALVKGDATTVRVPNLDISEIVRHSREKGVGLIV